MPEEAGATLVPQGWSFLTNSTSLLNASSVTNLLISEFNYISYGLGMSLILLLGFLGNILVITVLLQKEHRKKTIVPFIINLAVADLFIVVFGYPIALSSVFYLHPLTQENSRCKWSAFVNSSIGIASIATLTVISVQMWMSVTSRKQIRQRQLSNKKYLGVIVGIWSYGILTSCPPFIGWSRFVPGAAGISCGPRWASERLEDRAYSAFLVTTGFLLPLSIILTCYYKMFRVLRLKGYFSNSNKRRQAWRRSQRQIVQMIGVSVVTFVLSWSPYCIVSVISVFTGHYSLKTGTAEVPELLAKASVIYNPFVFAIMCASFRRSVKKLALKFRNCMCEQNVRLG